MHGDEWLTELAKEMKDDISKGVAPALHRLTVRELLDRYKYSKRGVWIVSRIRNRLEELNLRTVPDFEYAWIDSTISIELDREDGTSFSGEATDPTQRIGALEAANREPTTVSPDDSLDVATTIMQLHDFSQLPVMQGKRIVKGIVSWKSIGISKTGPGGDREFVRQCMDRTVAEVPIRAPLFEAVRTIEEHGYVLVRGEDSSITGIVTASDVSHQFAQLASPFLLVGEIEGYLRHVIRGRFTVEELKDASLGDEEGRPIAGSADLTFGGFCRLLENQERWVRLELNIDRKTFVKSLHSVRELRNEVMHFNPDGLSSEETKKLRDMARFFRSMARIGVL